MDTPIAPGVTGFDNAEYFQRKVRYFEEQFNPAEIADLAQQLQEFEPAQAITAEDIARDYPHYATLLVHNQPLGEFASRYAARVQPYLQAPFPLADGSVVMGPWIGRYKIDYFDRCGITRETLAGKHVLDIGSNAGFDTFYLSTLGPREIVGIDPTPLFFTQSLFLWAQYNCPNLAFRRLGWQEAKAAGLDSFDVVNCQGVLYHEPNPMQLIDALFELLALGGVLVLETHISTGEDKTARFVEGAFWGDISWFWIPTTATIEAMLRARGFVDITVRATFGVDSKNPVDPNHTTEGEPVGGRAFLTATKPIGHVYAPKYGLA